MLKSSYYITLILSVCVFLGGIYKRFIGTGIRLDLFVFYRHPKGGRLLTNILADSANMLTVSIILLLWYSNTAKRSHKRAILPFLVISLLDIADYFLFYKQMSVYKLPLLVLLIIIFNLKCQSIKQ